MVSGMLSNALTQKSRGQTDVFLLNVYLGRYQTDRFLGEPVQIKANRCVAGKTFRITGICSSACLLRMVAC